MARRTKKQKQNPQHPLTISWSPTRSYGEPVKGQTKKTSEAISYKNASKKSAAVLAQDTKTGSTKKDILKSLSLASLMLALELVIYLVAK